MRRSRLAVVVLGAALAVGATACGDDGGQSATGTDGGGSGSDAIQVSETSLGDVLTDGNGITLYLFDQDSEGTSVCEGDCLVAWPALEGEPGAGAGADAELIGTIERSDGTTQATYAGHPLYYFAQDSEPGDVNGQGVQDVWWVLDAAGTAIDEAPPDEPAEDESSSGGGVGY